MKGGQIDPPEKTTLKKLSLIRVKSCVRYILTCLPFKPKREDLRFWEKYFLIHLKISFRSREYQSLEF